MTYDKEQLDEQNQDVLKRNIEESKKLIEAREAKQAQGDTSPPMQDEPGSEPDVVPDAHVPAGGTSGSEQNLGGGYRSQSSH